MRQAILLSGVLIGLTVLPLHNSYSFNSPCDPPWYYVDPTGGEFDELYNLFSGYENISSFDIKSDDVTDGYDNIRSYGRPFTLYLPRPPKPSMTLQDVFILISTKIQSNFEDKSEPCEWLNNRVENDALPTEFNLERILMEHAEPIFKKIIRFIEDSDSATEDRLKKNLVDEHLFSLWLIEERNIQLTDIFSLVRLQLRKPTKESKMFLQMTLTKYITEQVTTDAIDTLACYIKQLDGNVFIQLIGLSKNKFHSLIEKVQSKTLLIIEEHGLSPYIELAYALVEELELINIHDATLNGYAIVMNAMQVMKGRDWNENLQNIVDAWADFANTMETLLDEIFCHKWPGIEKNMLQLLENLESDSLIDFLHEYYPRLEDYIEKEFRIMDSGYCAHWSDHRRCTRQIEPLFTLSQDGVNFPLTSYLKTNRGAINELFRHKIQVSEMKELLEWIYGWYSPRYDFDSTIRSFGQLIDYLDGWDCPLFTNVSLSNEDSDVILEPIRLVFDALAFGMNVSVVEDPDKM